jgi:hypothetical protein
MEATFVLTNSRKTSSAFVKGFKVFESISICPIFSPLTKMGITISDLTVRLQAI